MSTEPMTTESTIVSRVEARETREEHSLRRVREEAKKHTTSMTTLLGLMNAGKPLPPELVLELQQSAEQMNDHLVRLTGHDRHAIDPGLARDEAAIQKVVDEYVDELLSDSDELTGTQYQALSEGETEVIDVRHEAHVTYTESKHVQVRGPAILLNDEDLLSGLKEAIESSGCASDLEQEPDTDYRDTYNTELEVY